MKFTKWTNKYIPLSEDNSIIFNIDDKNANLQPLIDDFSKFEQIYVELGSGSGMHLVELASQNPKVLVIGIEKRFKRAVKTAQKAQKRDLINLKVLRGQAEDLADIFLNQKINGIFINFPDPWDKAKWKKHRMINENSLKDFEKLLTADGFISHKTDHDNAFKDALELISKSNFKIKNQSFDLLNSEYADSNIATEFEMLFKSQDKNINYVLLTK